MTVSVTKRPQKGCCDAEKHAMNVEAVPTASLAGMAAPYNPRKISPHDLHALEQSMTFFGVVEPVVVNSRTSHIVGGHQRVRAAAGAGIESLPVVYVDLDEASERQLNVALNRISGAWDDEKLADVIQWLDTEGADLNLAGFTEIELGDILERSDFEPVDFGGERLDKKSDVRCPECGAVFNSYANAAQS